MPRPVVEESSRLALRLLPSEKALITRAAALSNTPLSSFVLRNALSAASEIVEHAERLELSQRDSEMVLKLLENPPAPKEKLLRAARSMPVE